MISSGGINTNWRLFHSIFRRLTPIELQICDCIGISENSIVMFGQQSAGATGGSSEFKRDVHFTKNNNLGEDPGGIVVSGITDFKAFAEVNRDLIARMRHQRFYCTLVLKDLLSLDEKAKSMDRVLEYYGVTAGDIQGFQ